MSRHRAGGTTRLPRRLRFLAKLLLAVVVLTWAPTVAQAAFSDRDTAALSVGTYDIPAPAGVTGTIDCSLLKMFVTVAITDFGVVPRATEYTVTLTGPAGVVTTHTVSPTKRATTITRMSMLNGTYTLRIWASVGTWTGDPAVYPIKC
ncbi:hypothetical protein [uncultured Arthrobacter sp.]|uniref:hypothetical protein n=1 Tax=uncultured Arthrobacter sp. TaxID=114050 RepID=UPI0026278AA7|nr:hypothetical protein [uncultured Arthrobacter sp.]